MKNYFPALTLFFTAFTLVAQQPAHKHITKKNGLPACDYFYVGFANDTLFISTDEVKMYSYDGIGFHEVNSPPSKYMFREIHFLKKGYFTRNMLNRYWYRYTAGDWVPIPTPESNIVFRDTLYGFNADSVLYFNENDRKWTFLKTIMQPGVDIKNYHPYIYHNDHNIKILAYKNRENTKNNVLYDIMADTFIIHPDIDYFECQGAIGGENIYLARFSGELKWKYLQEPHISIFDFVPKVFEVPVLLKFKFEAFDNPTASALIQQQNSLHFFTFDTLDGINYSGSFEIARANFQKIDEQLYFMGSFEGMYKINPYITYYSPENSHINKSVRAIVNHQGSICTGGYGSGLAKLSGTDFVDCSPEFLRGFYKNILNGAFAVSDNEAWFFEEGHNTLLIAKNGYARSYIVYTNGERSWANGFYIDTLNNGRLAFSLKHFNFGMLDSIVGDRVYISSIYNTNGLQKGDTWCFDQDDNDRIWLARYTAGLAVYDTGADTVISFTYDLQKPGSFGVMSLYLDRYDKLWLGTNKGLYILPHASKFDIYHDDLFTKAQYIELPNADKSLVSAIKKAGKYIVAGNRSGLNFIINYPDIKTLQSKPIHQLIYGEDINGTGTELNSMYYDKRRYFWVSTKSGVLKVDMWNLQMDTFPVRIALDYLKNADRNLDIKSNEIEIDAVKRNISLCFKPVSNPSFRKDIYYEYALLNNKNDTLLYQYRTNNHILNVEYLPPGKYKCIVKAYKNGIYQDQLRLNIKVPHTVAENPWFWLSAFLLLLSIMALFMFYRNEKKRQLAKKELAVTKAKTEKEHLKVQALISAFNPHFINNSLYWVQAKYYDDPEMTSMISSLSTNMYYIFEKAKKGIAVHKLENELQLVENYITIQNIRFKDFFKYIPPDEETIAKYKDIDIIVMQIQIHVENAIEHGLRNNPGESFVKVEITEDENYYIITVIDNGIGRAAAKKMKSRGSGSGVKMLKELHSIFNRNTENKLKIKSVYKDGIFEKNGIKYGTKVIIYIPKNFNFKI